MSCDRKYKGQGPSKSGARPKKRKPPYKYKTTGSKVARRLDLPVIDLVDQPSTSSASSSVVDLDLVPEDNISQNLQLKSRSAHKLCFYDIPYPESEEDWTDIDSDEEDNCDELVNSASTRLIDLNILQAHVSESVSCRHCHADVNLVEVKRAGLGSIFRIDCLNRRCKFQKDFPSNKQIPINKSGSLSIHSVNRRVALAMRLIGSGLENLRKFCAVMDLPPPVKSSSFAKIKQTIHSAVTAAQALSMKCAANKEFNNAASSKETVDDDTSTAVLVLDSDDDAQSEDDEDNIPQVDDAQPDDQHRDIDGSIDGTWMTRGYSSQIGVVSMIGCSTGKIIFLFILLDSCNKHSTELISIL